MHRRAELDDLIGSARGTLDDEGKSVQSHSAAILGLGFSISAGVNGYGLTSLRNAVGSIVDVARGTVIGNFITVHVDRLSQIEICESPSPKTAMIRTGGYD